MFQGAFKVSLGTVEWYSHGTDFDISEITS